MEKQSKLGLDRQYITFMNNSMSWVKEGEVITSDMGVKLVCIEKDKFIIYNDKDFITRENLIKEEWKILKEQ